MAVVDDRIVQMEFNNRTFEGNVATTLNTLQKLKNALSFGKTNGLDDVDKSARKLNLSGIADAADNINKRFSTMGIAGVAAITNIANRAVNAGVTLLKSFTINPILDGFQQYQQQINATQTILANTASSGGNLKNVTATLAVLNDYANKTVYNFSDMATNLGTFTSAGVKLGPAADAIQGLSNIAAAAGAGTQQAAGAMYQLSQALGRGRIQAQDWNSVVAAGMASSNFKNALLETAKAMGVIKMPKTESIDQWVKQGNSFQTAMSKGQITSAVLIQTLQAMTGNMTDAQLAQKGYTAEQIKNIQAMASQAKAAAVNVKTLKALKDNLQQGVGSAWAQIFKTIFGDLPTATKNMTILSNVLNNIFVTPLNNLNDLLTAWVKLGGLSNVIGGLVAGFRAMSAFMKPIKDAFHQIFPPTSAKQLLELSVRFQLFMKSLLIGNKTATNLHRTFAGIFAVFHIGVTIIKQAYLFFLGLFQLIPRGNKGFLDITGNIGDFLVHLDNMLSKGGGIAAFFGKLYSVLEGPVTALGNLKNAIVETFDRLTGSGNNIGKFTDKLQPLTNLLEKAKNAIGNFFNSLGDVGKKLQPAIQAIGNVFAQLGNSIANSISGGNFTGVLKVVQTALLGGILLLVKNFFKKGIHVDLGGGFLGQMKETFEGLTGSMKAMQTQLKAKALLEIAGAIGILVASVVILSTIPSKKIADSLKALALGFGELLAGVAVLTKVTGGAGIVKLPVMAAALILISTAILTLSAAVKVLASMSWEELKRGLSAVGLLLGGLSAASVILSKGSIGLAAAGVGVTAIAVAMNILFGAVKLFSTLNWKDMLKGLTGVVGSLVGIAGAMKLMPKGMILQAAAILEISVAVNALYLAVKQFSGLNWGQMAKGLTGLVGSLGGIAAAMRLMPKGMVLQAAAITVIAGALVLLGRDLATIGNLSWKVIGKGLTGIAGALGTLALALNVMDGTLPGAAAVLVTAKALQIMVPVLEQLGKIKWGDIGKGLAVVASVLGIFIAAGYGADGAALGLVAIGVAAVGLGAGLALAGIGLKAIGEGFAALAKAGPAGIAVLISALQGFIDKIPALAEALAEGLINILKVIGENGPTIIAAFGTIIASMADAIVTAMPHVVNAIEALIAGFLKVLADKGPDIIAAGISLLEELLTGIGNAMPSLVAEVATIVVNLLNGLADHAKEIIGAGANLIVRILEGVASNLGKVISAGGDVIVSFVSGIIGQIGKVADAGARALVKFLDGLSRDAESVLNAGANLIISFVYGMSKKAVDIVDAAGNAILNFLYGLDAAVKKYEQPIIAECIQIGKDIITGAIKGVGQGVKSLGSAIVNVGKSALHYANPANWFGSPAKCIAEPLIDAINTGINNSSPSLSKTLKDNLQNAMQDVSKTISSLTNPLDGIIDTNPTIKPVLDLTNVEAGAKKIAELATTNVIPITAAASYVQAKQVSTAVQAAKEIEVSSATTAAPAPAEIKFTQNNYSPEALSSIDIYRQTNNQLSAAKKALGVGG